MERHTFEYRGNEHSFYMEFTGEAPTLDEMVDRFRAYLVGCGYQVGSEVAEDIREVAAG